MTKAVRRVLVVTAVLFAVCQTLPSLRAQGPRETLAWAPVSLKPAGWAAPNKPHWKLSEILARHKGQAAWRETVVSDSTLQAEYVSMAPGAKTPRMFRPDTRVWWIVQDGQVRFSIEGQEPFVASKGFMVQVPYRNVFSLETVGASPALFLEVDIAGATTMYPADETPVPLAGHEFVKVRVTGKGTYDAGNKPFVDFSQIVAGTDKTQRFIADARAVANIIRGRPIPEPRAVDKGHFHEESSEFWFVMEGQIRYRIGSLPVFIADQGDIVYVPRQTWHLASFAGSSGMSTRIAMNGYQDLLHNYQPFDELAGK